MMVSNLKLGIEKSQQTARLVMVSNGISQSIEQSFEILGRNFSKVLRKVSFFVLVILAFPLLVAIFFWYYWHVNKSVRTIIEDTKATRDSYIKAKEGLSQTKTLKELKVFESVEEYTEVRHVYDLFGAILTQLQPILDEKEDEVPLLLHPIYKPSVNFANALQAYNAVLKDILQLYDLNDQEGRYLKPLKEEELWNSRSKAYDYLA